MAMYTVEPDVVRPAPVSSPASLHSLAFVACLALPTSKLAVLPPRKSNQIKAFKDAPGSYVLVEETIFSKRIGEYDENSYSRSDYFRSRSKFGNFLRHYKDDNEVRVTRERNRKVWNIGDDGGWNFTMNGETRQPYGNSRQDGWIEIDSSTLKAEIDKGGNINSKYILSQQKQVVFPNPIQFDVQVKIKFEKNKMNINVSVENEHIEGNFVGQYVKLGEESVPDSYD